MADDTEDITTTFLNMIEECYESSGFADSPTALKAYYLDDVWTMLCADQLFVKKSVAIKAWKMLLKGLPAGSFWAGKLEFFLLLHRNDHRICQTTWREVFELAATCPESDVDRAVASNQYSGLVNAMLREFISSRISTKNAVVNASLLHSSSNAHNMASRPLPDAPRPLPAPVQSNLSETQLQQLQCSEEEGPLRDEEGGWSDTDNESINSMDHMGDAASTQPSAKEWIAQMNEIDRLESNIQQGLRKPRSRRNTSPSGENHLQWHHTHEYNPASHAEIREDYFDCGPTRSDMMNAAFWGTYERGSRAERGQNEFGIENDQQPRREFDYFNGTKRANYARRKNHQNFKLSLHGQEMISAFKPVQKCKFVGLANQGATCYLNSLLQTLFMTPEFRNAIYAYRHDAARDGAELDSIVQQLQRLFAELQSSKQTSIGTTALTKSFGWTEADAFSQHDVQELCQVLFNALELEFKGTHLSNLIDELYMGDLVDYVHCLSCGKRHEKRTKLMEISLVVRDQVDLLSSLRQFLQPELLNGNNQYRCSSCQQKSDANKGLKLSRLPYLLTFQLQRFDFNYETMQRVKINSRFEFPSNIDLSEFVDTTAQTTSPAEPLASEPTEQSTPATGLPELDATDVHSATSAEQPEVPAPSQMSCHYELFAVLVHSGTALGGHYYAYIKELASSSQGMEAAISAEPDVLGSWFKFNDTNVATCTELEMQTEAFGSAFAGAYMLIYRQVHPRNVKHIDNVPDHIREEMERVERARAEANDPNNLRLNIRYLDKVKSLVAKKQWTIEQLTVAAVRAFEVDEQTEADDEVVGPFEYRIRAYDIYYHSMGESFETRLQLTLSSLFFVDNKDLALERRNVNEKWQEAAKKEGDIQINVHVLKDYEWEYCEPVPLIINRYQTWAQLKALFEEKFAIPVEQQHICRNSFNFLTQLPPSMIPDSALINAYLTNHDRVNLERLSSGGKSRMWTLHEEQKHFINIKYCHYSDITTYDRVILFDDRFPLQQLKARLAELVQLPCDEFKLCQGTETLTQFEPIEFTDLDQTPERLNWVDNFKLMIKKGRPQLVGQKCLHVYRWHGDMTEPEFLSELVVAERSPVRDILNQIATKLPAEQAALPMRLRRMLRFQDQPITIQSVYDPGQTLIKQCNGIVLDGHKVLVELLLDLDLIHRSAKLFADLHGSMPVNISGEQSHMWQSVVDKLAESDDLFNAEVDGMPPLLPADPELTHSQSSSTSSQFSNEAFDPFAELYVPGCRLIHLREWSPDTHEYVGKVRPVWIHADATLAYLKPLLARLLLLNRLSNADQPAPTQLVDDFKVFRAMGNRALPSPRSLATEDWFDVNQSANIRIDRAPLWASENDTIVVRDGTNVIATAPAPSPSTTCSSPNAGSTQPNVPRTWSREVGIHIKTREDKQTHDSPI